MARKKTAKAADTNFRGLPMELPFTDPTEDNGGNGGGEPSVADLLSKLNGLEAELERERNDRRTEQMALLSAPPKPPVVDLNLDTKNLPDPIEKPDEYARELAARMERVSQGKQTLAQYNAEQTQQQNNRLNGVWNSFTKKYEAHAKNEKLVKFVAAEVLGEVAGRGIDTNKYIFGNTDQFMKEVASRMDEIVGKPLGAGADDDDEEDDPRTVGIFGGQQSGGKPAQAAVAAQDGGLFDDIREFQVKGGFYR